MYHIDQDVLFTVIRFLVERFRSLLLSRATCSIIVIEFHLRIVDVRQR